MSIAISRSRNLGNPLAGSGFWAASFESYENCLSRANVVKNDPDTVYEGGKGWFVLRYATVIWQVVKRNEFENIEFARELMILADACAERMIHKMEVEAV